MQNYEFDMTFNPAAGDTAEDVRREVAAVAVRCGGRITGYVERGLAGGWPLFVVEVFDFPQFERWLVGKGFDPEDQRVRTAA